MRFVRRGDSDARTLLDRIFDGLRDGDRPLFVSWDLYPPPSGPVPISGRQLPRTLQEIDAEIQRLEAHLEKRLTADREEDKSQHARRMTIIGGALLGLVEAGDAEADAMLKTILAKIPKKEKAAFDDWDPPTLPARAAQAEKSPPASNVAPTPTTPAVGGDDTAPKGGSEGVTQAGETPQRRARTSDGSTRSRSPRGDEKDQGDG